MSLAEQNPTYERVAVPIGALPFETNNAFRGLICDAAGTVTLRNSNREAAAVEVPVIPGINPHTFDSITATSGVTTVIAYR